MPSGLTATSVAIESGDHRSNSTHWSRNSGGHGGRRAGAHDVAPRWGGLQHPPHRVDVVAGVAPVALRVQVAEPELLREPQFDPGHAVGDLAADELDPAARRLVIEQNAAHG